MRLVVGRALGLIMALLLAVSPAVMARAQTPVDFDIAGGHFYQQTNGQGGSGNTGYSVKDDQVAPFFSEFQRLGSVNDVGYPVSRRFLLDGFVVQAFQKAIFQWRAEAGQAFFVNIMDRLHEAGLDELLFVSRATPRQIDLSVQEQGLPFNQIVQQRQALLDQNPAMRAFYFSFDDPVLRFGLPTSQVEDFGPVLVIRLQRAVLQQWKVDVPWASAGQVVVANGGDIAKEVGFLPSTAILPEPSASPASPPATPFGYGLQIDPANDPARALDLLTRASFNWVKVQVRWSDAEPAPGQFSFAEFDVVVAQAAARGIKVLMAVTAAPAWARPPGSDLSVSGPPADPATFGRFLSVLATRYRGRVQAIEVWNEQNLAREWGGLGRRLSASQYIELLRPAYAAIRTADPFMVVISGAPTPTGVNDGDIAIDDLVYLQQMYDAGLKDVSDAIGEHPSGYNNAPDDDVDNNSTGTTSFKRHPSFYFSTFRRYRDIMVANGDGGKQLWFTEFGWASALDPFPEFAYARENTEQIQAQYLVRALEIGRSTGYVAAMFVFNLNYAASADPQDRFGNRAFAILKADWTARPAYIALELMPK